MTELRTRSAVVLMMTMLAATLAMPAEAGASPVVPFFETIDCPRFVTAGRVEDDFDAPIELTCGYLHVLEDRGDPAKGTIRLFVTIAPPPGGSAFPDPVIGLGRELYWANPPSRQALGPTSSGRVSITIDARGAGYSLPNLRCPEVKQLTSPGFGVTLGTPEMEDALVNGVGACHDRLVGDGIDLASFNIAEMAADVEDLRVALGYDEVNLITYGTASEVLYEVLRRYPEHVRTAVMDSPIAPDVDRFTQAVVGTEEAVRAVFHACAASPWCAKAYPHLRGRWTHSLEALHDDPSEITDEGLDIVVDDATAIRYIRNDLMEYGGGSRLPLGVMDLFRHGWVNSDPIGTRTWWSGSPPLATGFDIRRSGVLSEGDFYSGLCHDELPFIDEAAFAAASHGKPWYEEAYADDWYQKVCDVWDVGQAARDPHRRLRTDVPTLVVAGRFDPFAPTSLLEDAIRRLPNGWLFEQPSWTHNLFGNVDCATGVRDDWMSHPHSAPDGACIEAPMRLRFVRPPRVHTTQDDSVITTFAGNAPVHTGSLGDGGRASQAILFPFDIDVDDAGNVYVHDASNLNGPNTDSAIRKIEPSGVITTVVGAPMGNAALAAPGDAADLRFGGFTGAMTVDGDGTIYLVIGNRILRVTPAGAVSTVAGTGASGSTGDGGPAIEATLKEIGDLDLDAAGNLYVATANRVRMIDTDGIITTIAGTGTRGFSGDGGPALQARMHGVGALGVDAAGDVFVYDDGNHRVRKIGTDGIISTVAGTGASCVHNRAAGDGGLATDAVLCSADHIWVDDAGRVVFSDPYAARVRLIDTDGIITTLAGSHAHWASGDGGPATLAQLEPEAAAMGPDGTLYIADSFNARIRKVVWP